MGMDLQTLRGKEVIPHLEPIAQLRITIFREFPYLYDGDIEYEKNYLRNYADSPSSVVVLALDKEKIVGASTALPLRHADSAFQEPFLKAGMALDSIFYFGESVLLKDYRGQGTGSRFFDAREQAAVDWGATLTAFCTVDRKQDHPLRPANYRSPESLWKKRGYVKKANLQCSFTWKTIPESTERDHTLTFWTKARAGLPEG